MFIEFCMQGAIGLIFCSKHSVSPTSAFSGSDLRVAGGTQRHEIMKIIGAAFGKRLDVVHFLGGCCFSLPFASLAQRVSSKVRRAYFSPCSAVTLASDRVALVTLVPSGFFLRMLLTKPTVCKVWTAGIGAGPFRLVRHRNHLVQT